MACEKKPYKWIACIFDTVPSQRLCFDQLGSEFDVVFWREKNSVRFATSHRDHGYLHIVTRQINSVHPWMINTYRVRQERQSPDLFFPDQPQDCRHFDDRRRRPTFKPSLGNLSLSDSRELHCTLLRVRRVTRGSNLEGNGRRVRPDS